MKLQQNLERLVSTRCAEFGSDSQSNNNSMTVERYKNMPYYIIYKLLAITKALC